MRDSFDAFLVLCVFLSVAMSGVWIALGVQVLRTARTVPTARDGIAMADEDRPDQSVCVVIPAHNEEDVIGELIDSLRAQDYANARFVLALDRCTDRTASIARERIGDDGRFEIVELTEGNPAWAGKVHAVWQGMHRSGSAKDADVLLFADADTRFHPSCVRATLALMNRRGLAMLTLLSTLTNGTWFERIVQPIAGLSLTYKYPLIKVNRERSPRPFANGQFMMFRREAYERIGGHHAVRDTLLEDLALAQLVREHKLRGGVFLADGMLVCRMYATWSEFRRGWKRIFTEAARRRTDRLRSSAIRQFIWGSVFPLASCSLIVVALTGAGGLEPGLRAAIGATGGIAILGTFVALAGVFRMSHAPISGVLLFPVGAILLGRIFADAARDVRRGTPTEWGGRAYHRPARS